MDKQQMLLGTEEHFLTLQSSDFPYNEPSRIQFLWEENNKRDVTIQVADAWRYKPARIGDRALMDIFRESDSTQLEQLNNVGLYLRVIYVRCIANKEGNAIERWGLFGLPKIANLIGQ